MPNYIFCIPRVNMTITKRDIYQMLNKMNMIHNIKKVQFIFKERENFSTVLIYFQEFVDNENGKKAMNSYLQNKDINIVYDFPSYLKLLPYKKIRKTKY